MVTNTPPPFKAPAPTIAGRLVLTFLALIIALGISLTLVYQYYVPGLTIRQIDLRADAIARLFGIAALEPMLAGDYPRVEKITETTVKLPGVAYAAIIDQDGKPVAGLFGDAAKFGPELAGQVKEQGFLQQTLGAKRAQASGAVDRRTVTLGSQDLYEIALLLENSGAEIRVALFTDQVEPAVQAVLTPLAFLLVVAAVLGSMMLFVVTTRSDPVEEQQ